jgi:hypothetical protein
MKIQAHGIAVGRDGANKSLQLSPKRPLGTVNAAC